VRIGYLVNQYPKISHTFIRTEITGLERIGTEIERFSIRPSPDELIDPEDRLEAECTRVLLSSRLPVLARSLSEAAIRPRGFTRAVALASGMGITSERGLGRHYAYLAEACLLRKWALESDVRHIHAHFGTNSAAVAMLCHALGGPTFSFTVHGPEEFDKARLISLTTKLQHASFAVAVCDFGRSQLWRYCSHSEWGKIHVVRCGVGRAFMETDLTDVPDAPRFVCVGRLCEQKGQLLLIQAAAELKKDGQAFEIVLVGDGEMRSVLESAISDLGLRGYVSITGWQSAEQVRGQIQASRALVLPSFAEGLPVVIMEALALCRPVISTYVAGIPELVTTGVNGWLTPAGALPPLVAAMRDALATPVARLMEMGRAGRARVRDEHDADKSARILKELFTKAMAA
jgi:glycosyltransferase involved in cell wall biosynthesis